MSTNYIKKLIEEHKLPDSYAGIVNEFLLPISQQICADLKSHRPRTGQAMVLGIQGSQGSGKSTSAQFIKEILQQGYGYDVVVLSIDDFYKTKESREKMAREIHPLFATRGVPGTHDMALMEATISALLDMSGSSMPVPIPRFNKATDDRFGQQDWDQVAKRPDLIIFEGWCIASLPQSKQSLAKPVNGLEENEDPDGVWRQFVNTAIATDYQKVWSHLDRLLVLQAPSFECVFEWRQLQEDKLRERVLSDNSDASGLMTEQQVARFISHYQRLTEHQLKTLKNVADWVLMLNQSHGIDSLVSAGQDGEMKLVSTDLDGTLLDHHSYSWQAAKFALRSLRAKSIPLLINTSKTFSEVIDLQRKLGIDSALVVENGSLLFLPKGQSICSVACEDIVQIYEHESGQVVDDQDGFFVISFGSRRETILAKAHELRKQHNYQFEGFYDWTVEQIAESTGLSIEQSELASQKQCSEPIVWRDSDERLQAFTEQLAKHSIQILRGGRYMHLQGDCNKATPLNWLKNKLAKSSAVVSENQSDLQNIKLICLGDNHNDIAMLQAADVAVCVKSPVSDYPKLDKTDAIYTQLEGPQGWNQAILDMLCH